MVRLVESSNLIMQICMDRIYDSSLILWDKHWVMIYGFICADLM
jgi:hypothetical protein